MPSFVIKSRTTHAIEESTVDAPSREEAITQAIAAVPEGETIEVMNCTEIPGSGSGGATGATGAAG